MMLKNVRRIKKRMLLGAGITLCCVAAIEAGQEMVKAIDLQTVQPAIPLESRAQPFGVSPDLDLRLADPATTPTQADAAQSGVKSGTAESPQRQKLAINTGSAAEPERVAQISSAEVATSTWNGASFPVENFQAYTSPFGYRSSPYGGYSQEFHYGLDMAAPDGSYIRNWWGGKVVEVSDDSNCGTSVVVESGPWLHIYCHMQGHVEKEDGKRYMIDRDGGIQIWENQQLPAGSRIGRVGMTGRTTGPHLHWGLKYNENWVDPALVLRAMYFNQRQTTALSEEQVQ
jgi:murein DD-endopeptidase MepM/ murein hydrolase activator NlpD